MDQKQINDAMENFLATGDPAQVEFIMHSIYEGEVAVTIRSRSITLNAIESQAAEVFAQQMTQLWKHSGMTQRDLAEAVGVHLSVVVRLLSGRTLPHWPTVEMVIMTLGGDRNKLHKQYVKAKLERTQLRHEREMAALQSRADSPPHPTSTMPENRP